MSESPTPDFVAAELPGLDLLAERSVANVSLWPLYDGAMQLIETHFGGMNFDSVLKVRPYRNAAYEGVVQELTSLYEQHKASPIGPALLFRLALLNLVANRPHLACELIELAVARAAHASDQSRLLLELARAEMERLNHAGALSAYRRLLDHDPGVFPFPHEKYRLESVLGSGGFSTVFLCREINDNSLVVVKSLDITEHNSQRIDPFQEAELLDQVQQPGIVKLLAKGYVDPAGRRCPYMVLEYLPGMTLHDYVTRCGPLSWQNWLPVARQILATLQSVHSQGIVHRDLKPGNLLLQFESTGWQVKLIDFGIAIRQQFPAGTLGFAAPEQLEREAELGPALDVYAFGRTTCFALTGQPEIEADAFGYLPSQLLGLIRDCQSRQARTRPTIPALLVSVDGLLARGWSPSNEFRTSEIPPESSSAAGDPNRVLPGAKTWIPEEGAAAMNRPSPGSMQRVLVVESLLEDRNALEGMLVELGFEVDCARGWSTAWKAFSAAQETGKPYRVVFASADLNRCTALNLVRQLRDADRNVKFVVTFDPNSQAYSRKSLESDLYYFMVRMLPKPFELDALREALEPKRDLPSCSYSPPSYASEPTLPEAAGPITTASGPPAPPGNSVGAAEEVPARSSGEIAMWPRGDDPAPPPDTAPPWVLRPGLGPAQSRPSPGSMPPSSPAPTAAPQHNLPTMLHSAWEALQEKVGGWFARKPSGERFESKADRPIEEWAKPLPPRTDGNAKSSPEQQRWDLDQSPASAVFPSPVTTDPQRDEVDCTVFAPPQITAGETIMIQALLHLPAEAPLAAALAKQYDDAAALRGARSLDTTIERGSRLAFQLSIPGLNIDDPTPPPIVWRGRPDGVQFGVTAPADSPVRTVIGTVLVTLESVPIGQIKFKLAVQASATPAISPLMTTTPAPVPSLSQSAQPHRMSRYQMVFISYASPDRDEVLKRVQMLKRFNVNFFQDVLSLEPGERWEQSLYKHIDQSDLFLLFWSTAAKNSKWVREEVKYALGRRSTSDNEFPEIVPIVLEGPPVPEPLPELSHLHFNDQILHFVAERYSSAAP